MLKIFNRNVFLQALALVWFGMVLPRVSAHGDMNWNEYTIDNKTDSIDTSILHVQKVIADIILARRPVTDWPDTELLGLTDELTHLTEEIDHMLNHFNENGIQVQLSREQRAHPRVGRAVTASDALKTAVAMIEYINSLQNLQAFEQELHEGGKVAYMYDLLESYRDKMAVYQALVSKSAD